MKFLLNIFIFKIIILAFVESKKNDSETNEQFARIIGGYRPQEKEFAKHIVSIRYGYDDKVYGSNHFCAGSIISSRVILTARHCVYDRLKHRPREKTLITVVAGNTQRLRRSRNERTYGVRKILYYPDFDYGSFSGDLALLYLSDDIKEDGETIERIGLADEMPVPGMQCMVLGWGKILYNGPAPDEILYLNLTLLPMEDCTKFIQISSGTMCAGEERFTEKTAGSGDSGGPLICNGKVAGVASFIIPIRTYFTSVWHYREWINRNGAHQWRKQPFSFLISMALGVLKFL